jgi:hypothetical protein
MKWTNIVIFSIGPAIRLFSVSGIRPGYPASQIRYPAGYLKGAGLCGWISGASLISAVCYSTVLCTKKIKILLKFSVSKIQILNSNRSGGKIGTRFFTNYNYFFFFFTHWVSLLLRRSWWYCTNYFVGWPLVVCAVWWIVFRTPCWRRWRPPSLVANGDSRCRYR